MRKVVFTEGEFYHLYNRGVEKRNIFTSPAEYRRFLAYLYLLNTQKAVRPADIFGAKETDIFSIEQENPLVALGAYCLMPNHFHLYATPLVDGGISKLMQRVQTAYTMYFNTKHKRSGVLFQGAFKATHVAQEEYARFLFSYIHLNPAKLKNKNWKNGGRSILVGMREHLLEYPYSSLKAYVSNKHTLTNPAPFPAYLASMKDVREHIDAWLDFREAEPHGYSRGEVGGIHTS